MTRTILAALALSASLSAQQPVAVYVTSAGASSGFTDPSKDNRDTVKDLKDDLKDAKGVRLVDSASEAQIVLTVQDRRTSDLTAGLFGGAARDRMIHVTFQAGTMQTELTASAQGGTMMSGGAWSKAAGKIAKQVKEWIAANRSQLQADNH